MMGVTNVERQQKILEWITAEPGITMMTMSRRLGLNRNTVQGYLNTMMGNNLIHSRQAASRIATDTDDEWYVEWNQLREQGLTVAQADERMAQRHRLYENAYYPGRLDA